MRKLITTFFILTTIFSTNCFGQKDSVIFSLSAGGDFNYGNVNSTELDFSTEISGYNTNHNWSIIPTYKYISNDKSPSNASKSIQNEFYSVQNYTFKSQKLLKMLFFSEIEHSEVKKIAVRANLGFGLGYKLYNKKGFDISISEVILPNYYQNLTTTSATSKSNIKSRDNTSLFLSTRFKFVYKSGPITFSSIEMFQPSLYTKDYDGTIIKTKDNINFRSNNTLDFLIRNGISFGISYTYDYQSYLNYINSINNMSLSASDGEIIFYIKKGFIKKRYAH